MQHDQSKITGLRKVDRTRSARTPDRSDVRGLEATMHNVYSPKRKVHTSRLSMMPPALNTSTLNLRKMEMENTNLELELAYSEYIASHTELFLEKKILKDTEISLSNSMKSLHEETKSLYEKCKLIETRIKDIQALSCLNDYAELIQLNSSDFKDKQEKYEIKNILSQLEKLLSSFNILRCENIVLPNNTEEVQQLQKTLTDCCTIWQQISDPVKCDAFDNVTTEYENFVTMYHEILNVKKIVEDKIYNLQLEILKACSYNLSENNV